MKVKSSTTPESKVMKSSSTIENRRKLFFLSASERFQKKDILSLGVDKLDKNGLQLNPNVDPQFIETYMPKDINYVLYSNNINCNIDYVKEKGPDRFCFRSLSDNLSIKPQDVIENKNYPWDPTGLSRNPNFSVKFFYENASTFQMDIKEYYKFHDIRRKK